MTCNANDDDDGDVRVLWYFVCCVCICVHFIVSIDEKVYLLQQTLVLQRQHQQDLLKYSEWSEWTEQSQEILTKQKQPN